MTVAEQACTSNDRLPLTCSRCGGDHLQPTKTPRAGLDRLVQSYAKNTMANVAILEDKQCEALSGGSSRADRYGTRIRDSYNTNNSYNFNSNYNSLNGSGIYAIGSTLG